MMSGSMKILRSAMRAAERRAAADEAAAAERREGAGRRLRVTLLVLQVWLAVVTWGGLASLVWYLDRIERGPVGDWPAALAEALGLPSHRSRPVKLGSLVLPSATLELQILFAPGSDDLSREARRDLAAFAIAFKRPDFRHRTVHIIGHADSRGSAAYNLALSRRRAERVRDFLVSESGLPAGNLIAFGRGEASPVDPSKPDNPLNRRVRVLIAGLTDQRN